MGKFVLLVIIAMGTIAGTVAATHYFTDSTQVAAEPGGN